MQDVKANPLDYVEGGALNEGRRFLSEILDPTSPDFSAFTRRGRKTIVAIGTTRWRLRHFPLARFLPGGHRQDGPRAGRSRFARFFVMPQTGHGLSGNDLCTER